MFQKAIEMAIYGDRPKITESKLKLVKLVAVDFWRLLPLFVINYIRILVSIYDIFFQEPI